MLYEQQQQDVSSSTQAVPLSQKLDIHIGQTIKRLRLKHGISQVFLSKELGVSVTQLQKYESGKNRVSASRLYILALLLRTSPSYFFDSFVAKNDISSTLSDNKQEPFVYDSAFYTEQEDLLEAYFSIENSEKRHWHLEHIKQSALSE